MVLLQFSEDGNQSTRLSPLLIHFAFRYKDNVQTGKKKKLNIQYTIIFLVRSTITNDDTGLLVSPYGVLICGFV